MKLCCIYHPEQNTTPHIWSLVAKTNTIEAQHETDPLKPTASIKPASAVREEAVTDSSNLETVERWIV